MILGGQHITSAVFWMRRHLLKQKVPVDKLPLSYQVVRAIVLKVNTPHRCLVAAAGHHQSVQHDSVEPSITDVMRRMGQYSAEKVKRNLSERLKDEEIYNVLQQMGLVRGQQDILTSSKDTVGMTPDEAEAAQEKVVCNCIPHFMHTHWQRGCPR